VLYRFSAKEEGRGSSRADRPTRAHPRAQAERKEETAAKAGDAPARKESSNDESRLAASLRLSSGQSLAKSVGVAAKRFQAKCADETKRNG